MAARRCNPAPAGIIPRKDGHPVNPARLAAAGSPIIITSRAQLISTGSSVTTSPAMRYERNSVSPAARVDTST